MQGHIDRIRSTPRSSVTGAVVVAVCRASQVNDLAVPAASVLSAHICMYICISYLLAVWFIVFEKHCTLPPLHMGHH